MSQRLLPPEARRAIVVLSFNGCKAAEMHNELAFIDFETTGLSPDYDRTIEVAAAIVRNGEVTGTFVQLRIPS